MQTTPLRQWRFATIANPAQPGLIRYACYAHKSITPTKAIILLNGRAEWIEKYSFIPDELGLDQETLWITLDHRGQGVSAGKRAFIDSYMTYVADLQSVVAAAVGDLPYSVIAHSMGGLISLFATLTGAILKALSDAEAALQMQDCAMHSDGFAPLQPLQSREKVLRA